MPSAMPDGLEARVALGFLTKLDEWDLVTWSETEPYTAETVRPAYLGPSEPANAPHERVIVTARTALQIRGQIVDVPLGVAWRGPVDGDDLQGVNFLGLLARRLYRIGPLELGGVRVAGARIESSGVLPRDSSRRLMATATILFRARIASANT